MPNKRTKEALAQEAAMKVAEGIGEALAGVVNRLEALDAERENVYRQLLGLQKRFSEQIARFSDVVGPRVKTATRDRPGAGRPPRKTRRTADKGASPRKNAPPRPRKRGSITCGICGTSGHNARGHAKWEASQ